MMVGHWNVVNSRSDDRFLFLRPQQFRVYDIVWGQHTDIADFTDLSPLGSVA